MIQEYGIQHHRSSAYRPQTNGAVEAANKNIKRILRKMVETSRDWSEKLPFALWAYRTSFRTSTEATPYSLVYGMEAVLPVEIEMRSLRVALKQHVWYASKLTKHSSNVPPYTVMSSMKTSIIRSTISLKILNIHL